jgi:hypothetical protein
VPMPRPCKQKRKRRILIKIAFSYKLSPLI